MKTEKFIRKSFPVEGVRVTEENFDQVAKWTKGNVCYTDSKIAEKFKKPVQKWIEIEVKNALNDRQTKAFVGDYVLFANNGFKIYTPGAFDKNFDRAPKPQAPKPKKAKIHVDNGHEVIKKTGVTPNDVEVITDAKLHSVALVAEGPNASIGVHEVSFAPEGVPLTNKAGEKVGEITGIEKVDGGIAITAEIVLEHNHPLDAKCDDNGCETERYVDGIHKFTDFTVLADADGYRPVTP